jgi:sugar/nucleoside kinase (ribokinase family)
MDEFPQLGKDVVGTAFKMTPGEAFISVVSLHRLGVNVGWAADFGNDEFSEFALTCARQEELDESLFAIHDRPYRRISAAASYPHERALLTYYDPDPKIPASISALTKSQAKIFLIPGLYYGPFLDGALKLIRRKKMKLVMDGNSSCGDILGKTRESAAIRKALNHTDVFLPNAQEAKRLTGESNLELAIQWLGEFCPLVVVKDGPNGSIAYTNNTCLHVPGIQVKNIDTTGAGDNFNAGFLRAWLDGQSIEMCLKWGNIVGGLSTTEIGGTTRKITPELVKETLLKAYP